MFIADLCPDLEHLLYTQEVGGSNPPPPTINLGMISGVFPWSAAIDLKGLQYFYSSLS
tara:strand:- start:90 stop:263 length:174 start_codon:yes stop_codon:yes gene_type:complete